MQYILQQVYPDDLIELSKAIRLRVIDDYLIQSRIAANPHMQKDDAEQFITTLVNERRQIEGFDPTENDQLDRAGLANLKAQMAGSRHIAVH